MQVLAGEGDQARRSMIRKVDEHIVVGGRLQDPAGALALHCGLVTIEDSHEVFGSDQFAGVVDPYPLVHIDAWVLVAGLVEDFALERVLQVVGQIIEGESDDTIGVEFVLDEDLVGVVDVGLVSVVGVGVGPGYQHCPALAPAAQQQAQEQGQGDRQFHRRLFIYQSSECFFRLLIEALLDIFYFYQISCC